METKTSQMPSFTVSLRGYDREEVDDYLDSLAEALAQVDEAKEQNRRLQAHIARLNSRLKDLEERISSETPKTGALVAERIAILLRTAEDTAADTITRSEATAAQIVAEANSKLTEAEDALRAAVSRGEAQARTIEATARGEAAEIIAEAEARASARTRQIEQWAEEVVSRTRAEEARMLREHQERRNRAVSELTALAEQRDAAAITLARLRETLGEALGLVEVAPDAPRDTQPARGPSDPRQTACESSELVEDEDAAADIDSPETASWADRAGPTDRVGPTEDRDRTGDMEAPNPSPSSPAAEEDEEFEAKLEAWVSEGARPVEQD